MSTGLPPPAAPAKTASSGGVLKWVLLGCGGLVLLVGLGVFGALWWLFSGPESGVKLANEMDTYAVKYLEEHRILAPGESVLAYYDATIAMDGTEAAILTPERVIYHKDGQSTAVALKDVTDVRHRTEGFVGDVIEVEDVSGRILKIEIAPLNQGETFNNALGSAWRKARPPEPAGGS